MTVELLRDVLGWSAVINYAVLLLWFLIFRFGHDWMYGLHRQWFKLSPESFDAIQYAGMAFLKLCVFVFNLAPYLALRMVA